MFSLASRLVFFRVEVAPLREALEAPFGERLLRSKPGDHAFLGITSRPKPPFPNSPIVCILQSTLLSVGAEVLILPVSWDSSSVSRTRLALLLRARNVPMTLARG